MLLNWPFVKQCCQNVKSIFQFAHGDMVAYHLAVVELSVDGLHLMVEAALLNTLSMVVLLGRDVHELRQLLNERTCKAREFHGTTAKDNAMMESSGMYMYCARKVLINEAAQ